MKNRAEGEMMLARECGLHRTKLTGILPKTQVLDDEASKAFKEAIINSGMKYQLTLPDDYRRDVAEKAIQTWKDYFMSNMSGTAATFLLRLWDQCVLPVCYGNMISYTIRICTTSISTSTTAHYYRL